MNTGKLSRLTWDAALMPRDSLWAVVRVLCRRLQDRRGRDEANHRVAQVDAIREVDPRTLCDIGAPSYLVDRAIARRESQRLCLAELHIGVAAGSWRHW